MFHWLTGLRSRGFSIAITAALVLVTAPTAFAHTGPGVLPAPQVTTKVLNTFVVNITGDQPDGNPGDGLCEVDVAGRPCTLRAAIEEANQLGGGPHRIEFDIPGDGPHLIQPASPLPVIDVPVEIDGTSQPIARCPSIGNAATLRIILDGRAAGSSNALTFAAGSDGSSVSGLVIRGWSGNGIKLESSNNLVTCNLIGVDVDGSADAGNSLQGIHVTGANNQIGGADASQRNVISGNGASGIYIQSPSATGNTVKGNYIGTDVSATSAIPNDDTGVRCHNADNNTIGGPEAGAGNVISGNGLFGVHLRTGSDLNQVLGNIIGLNASGTAAIPNFSTGVYVVGSGENKIGDYGAGNGNLISGNGGVGIYLLDDSNFNYILNNIIGLDASGSVALGNTQFGVLLDGSGGNTIGGPGNGNVITANNNDEIELRNSVANQIDSNRIGTNSAGTTIIASNGVGIVLDDSDVNLVLRNTIAGNSGGGIDVVTAAVRNTIYANHIYNNTGLGIDLGNNGVTPNDPGDSDTGDNQLQNYPILTIATESRVKGMLDTLPGDIDLHFYVNDTCDASGYGEGESYVGLHEFYVPGVTTLFSYFVPAGALQIGQYVTATATDSDGNTSEFSACLEVTCSSPDVDDDGDVDVNDIIAVATQWNAQTYNATYDLNCDNDIDILDVQIAAGAFGL